MNSLLNFVFLNDRLITNGEGLYGHTGPFLQYLKENQLSYSLNGRLKEGFKNVLPIEIRGAGWGVRDIPNEVFKFINDNNIKVLIINLPDPMTSDTYKFSINCLKDKLDLNKLIYIDTNLRLSEKKDNLPYKIYTFNFFIEEATWKKEYFFNVRTSLNYFSKEIQPTELNNFRNKKFLSFNRGLERAHRFVLLDEYLKGSFADSHFSFIRPIEYFLESQEFFKKYCGVSLKDDDVSFYNKKLPIELDTQEISRKYDFTTSNTFKKELFLDSCINIVTETTFLDNELFLSEKILKPILNYQPFIVIGPYGYLSQLKQYGFKTFSEFWDEGYDEIKNPIIRMKHLISLIKLLNNKSIEELNDIYKSTIDICIYNRNLFYSLELDSLKVILGEIENEW